MKSNVPLGIILLLSVILFTANIGGVSIYILDEAKNSTCAREMLDRADWVVPTFNYNLRTDKPPLHYFFMMMAYQLFGVNEFAARFFSALFGIFTVLITYFFTRRFIGEQVAFLSALVLLSSLQVVTQFHLAVPDPYLIFFFTAALFLFYAYETEKKNWQIYLAYACLGLGMLTKGPVALVLPGAIVFFFLLFRKKLKWSVFAEYKMLTGLLLAFAIAVPWYVAVGIQTNWEWTEGFFLKHNLERYTETMEGHGGSFALITLFIFTGLFPFSIFIIQALMIAWKERKNPVILFVLIAVLTVTVFFSFSSTKLPNYPALSFPFVAILLGYFLNQLPAWAQSLKIKWSYFFYLIVAVALPIAIYLVLEDELNMPALTSLSYYFLAVPLGGLAALVLLYRRKFTAFTYVLAASWMLTMLAFYYIVFPKIDQQSPVMTTLEHLPKEKKVMYLENYNPAFSFYIRKPILPFSEQENSADLNEDVFILTWQKHADAYLSEHPYQVIYQKKELFEPKTTILQYANPSATLSEIQTAEEN